MRLLEKHLLLQSLFSPVLSGTIADDLVFLTHSEANWSENIQRHAAIHFNREDLRRGKKKSLPRTETATISLKSFPPDLHKSESLR